MPPKRVVLATGNAFCRTISLEIGRKGGETRGPGGGSATAVFLRRGADGGGDAGDGGGVRRGRGGGLGLELAGEIIEQGKLRGEAGADAAHRAVEAMAERLGGGERAVEARDGEARQFAAAQADEIGEAGLDALREQLGAWRRGSRIALVLG